MAALDDLVFLRSDEPFVDLGHVYSIADQPEARCLLPVFEWMATQPGYAECRPMLAEAIRSLQDRWGLPEAARAHKGEFVAVDGDGVLYHDPDPCKVRQAVIAWQEEQRRCYPGRIVAVARQPECDPSPARALHMRRRPGRACGDREVDTP